MDAKSRLNKILSEIKKLNKEEQLVLVRKITNMIDEAKPYPKPVSLIQLSGLVLIPGKV